MNPSENRYLCFRLDDELYGAPLLEVKEVLGIPEITPIPQAPSFYLGIMNLRGQVITVVDLRLKFGLRAQKLEETCIIIFEYSTFSIGVVVDEVHSVIAVKQGELCAPPEAKHSKKDEFISGIINHGKKMILTIDIIKALDLKDDATKNLKNQSA